MQIIKKLQGNS